MAMLFISFYDILYSICCSDTIESYNQFRIYVVPNKYHFYWYDYILYTKIILLYYIGMTTITIYQFQIYFVPKKYQVHWYDYILYNKKYHKHSGIIHSIPSSNTTYFIGMTIYYIY